MKKLATAIAATGTVCVVAVAGCSTDSQTVSANLSTAAALAANPEIAAALAGGDES